MTAHPQGRPGDTVAVVDIDAAVAQLVQAAEDVRLTELCCRHDICLVTVFGSAVRDPAGAHDLDVAVLFRRGADRSTLKVLAELIALAGTEAVDLMVLNDASPSARFNGLVGATPLFEDEPGRWAVTQMAAAGAVFDTEWMRRAELARMAAS